MKKSQETRQRISEIALASFQERGYEQTTLRLIAEEAGISVGNAYYYFPTKNHLVQELYARVQQQHLDAASAALADITALPARLETALLAGLDGLAPYHDSAPGFLAAAISPTSPVNPFGPDSSESRAMARRVFELVAEGATTRLDPNLRRRMPELMWLAYMGLALYWVYDNSPGQRRSRRVVTRAVKLFGTLLPFTRVPLMRGPVNEFLDLVEEATA